MDTVTKNKESVSELGRKRQNSEEDLAWRSFME
jgi:hypothetical protein